MIITLEQQLRDANKIVKSLERRIRMAAQYDPPVKKKIVKNLMSGKMISIDADTPRSCDPSSELYWSM